MSGPITHNAPPCQRCGEQTKWTESTLSANKKRVVHSFRCGRCDNRMIVSEPVQDGPSEANFSLIPKWAC